MLHTISGKRDVVTVSTTEMVTGEVLGQTEWGIVEPFWVAQYKAGFHSVCQSAAGQAEMFAMR